MDQPKWLPLFVREAAADAREEYEAIREEPSPGLQRAFLDYLGGYLLTQHYGRMVLQRSRTIAVEQALSIDLHGHDGDNAFARYDELPLNQQLSVVDYCVHHFTKTYEDVLRVKMLSESMRRSRFAYEIDENALSLVRVLPAGVDESVRSAFGVKVSESKMREAVHWATGLKPDGIKSFDAMVRALEAVVIPELSPNDAKATLGKVLGGIRAGQIKLACVLPRAAIAPQNSLPTADVVRGMLELVWSGYERHAVSSGETSVDGARSLLGVVGSLVSWFGSGAVTKAS